MHSSCILLFYPGKLSHDCKTISSMQITLLSMVYGISTSSSHAPSPSIGLVTFCSSQLDLTSLWHPPSLWQPPMIHDLLLFPPTSCFFLFETKANMSSPKHKRQLTTWQIFCQVERRFFHRRKSNRQPLP